MVTHWLPVASALRVVCQWGQGHGRGSGTGDFGFLPFLSGAEQKPEHPQGYSLATLSGICPSGAVLSLRIARALNRGHRREQCTNVPLTSSRMSDPLLLANTASRSLHVMLQETKPTRRWSWPQYCSWEQISHQPRHQHLLGIQTGRPGTTAADVEVAFPLGVKTYCQSEHLQPCA